MPHTIKALYIPTGMRLSVVEVSGSGNQKFRRIKDLADGAELQRMTVEDYDQHPAAAWVDEDGLTKGLPHNVLASLALERPIFGPVVITGLGHGEDEAMSDVPKPVLDRVVAICEAALADQPLGGDV